MSLAAAALQLFFPRGLRPRDLVLGAPVSEASQKNRRLIFFRAAAALCGKLGVIFAMFFIIKRRYTFLGEILDFWSPFSILISLSLSDFYNLTILFGF